MDKLLKDAVSKQRLLLGNQYALIEYLEESSSSRSAEVAVSSASRDQISESRKLLQDPYAYLDDSGNYSALTTEVNTASVTATATMPAAEGATQQTQSRYSNEEIEIRVKGLQAQLWKDRSLLWNHSVPSNPIEILDPAAALYLLGYKFELVDGLGQHRIGSRLIEVAGLIDRSSKLVQVSQRFSLAEGTFTAAHELGHAALHSASGGVHRDRPLDGTARARDQSEFEADKFATYFLMPERLVRARFELIFGKGPFVLNEKTAFAISSLQLPEFLEKYRARRDLSRLIAGAERYNGRQVVSLAAQFRVSIGAMAIRLEELDLVPG